MPDRTYLLGLDVGTQSLRAALVDLSGRTVAYGVSPIETGATSHLNGSLTNPDFALPVSQAAETAAPILARSSGER